MTGHPIRNAALHIFARIDANEGGAQFIARFYPYDIYPVFFNGSTADEAVENAEKIRASAIEKHESSVIARQEARAKADATRKAKKAKENTK